MRQSTSLLLAGLAGLVNAQSTPIVYVTTYVTRCDCPATTLGVTQSARSSAAAQVAPTGLVVVAGQPARSSAPAVVVAAGASPVVAPVVVASIKAVPAVVAAAPAPVAPAPVANNVATPAAPKVNTPVVAAAAPPTAASPVIVAPAVIAPTGPAACPATAHQNFLGSKSYPRIITPVSTTNPARVYGPQYFASIGNGNTTIFTFDYQKAGTCTIEFKFPTKEYIKSLQGTTDWTVSGPGGPNVPVTLYTLATVADANASFQSKPARISAVTGTLIPGTNTTLTTFACPVGKSVSYELVAESGQALTFFEDYNPPPLGLLLLQC
ncbi:ubiquitin 3 binding protein But2 C-terminal domain-domain-containing protein [Protomyces lactucae-debilis]|uniref:Ubiquitin 3 binding protein But2 C-terminal domain-domain-containing protein n=1 Tax=Protomyces lactucae-debilis TaxID=2754530 RepID=A0A1Y2FAG2_PROLT|nr:ubiquitin 3 binding protein But2 C-terminal domain-containing protein [Protomyces lactucae-debilis]ORY80898.1 ubiquitin 3 binding protein But2 C-terminal domain-domain-containing protein [Protomyces lactucae-debilis]